MRRTDFSLSKLATELFSLRFTRSNLRLCRFGACLGSILLSLTAAQGSELTLAGITVPSKLKFASWTAEESALNLVGTFDRMLPKGFEKEGHVLYNTVVAQDRYANQEVSYFKPKERTQAVWEKLAQLAGTRHVLFLTIIDLKQKNASAGAVLNILGKPQSETSVKFALEWFDAEQNSLRAWTTIESSFAGPYFGTTKQDEMSGDPAAKAIMIRNENRKRMEAIVNAVWAGIHQKLVPNLSKH